MGVTNLTIAQLHGPACCHGSHQAVHDMLICHVSADEVAVMVNDDKLSNFRFSANNVLSWESEPQSNHSGWLLFSELPAGPYCIGHVAMPVRNHCLSVINTVLVNWSPCSVTILFEHFSSPKFATFTT